ncbi:hypothetical protein JAAARDRAFT_201596 [Jaapia argillacea MUCL 33604]|uniref:MoaB/Mog domain-containing protein n=1 Tax=Jaapia argillacea MUCL 33604 TaxID=933084 RepID=A0A067QL15_9AGAM|nr:hypothetical protein JAAARDRAFT_201596 [Jaapia argillacea MUCL 33604]
MSTPIRVAILTVSDTASATPSLDVSGPTIRAKLAAESPAFSCTDIAIVPDDEVQIRDTVNAWCDSGNVDWVITTGGTGFGVRDRTPEALSPLIDRQAPGLVHLLLSTSLSHTPLASLSRPIAGTIKNTLLITLPGSVKAVKECLAALLTGGVVQHAVELIRGGSGKVVHEQLSGERGSVSGGEGEPGHGHGHHHHHHHHGDEHHHDHGHPAPKPRTPQTLSHDPNLPVSARHRISPYEIITLDSALSIITEQIKPLGTHTQKVTPSLKNSVLAEDIYSTFEIPKTYTTNVDGYAVRSSEPPGTYKVHTPKSHPLTSPLPPNTIYRVNTGGPIPQGADAVVMVEDTLLVEVYDNSEQTPGEEKLVEIKAQVDKGENVRKPGSDVSSGELVMRKGEVIGGMGGEVGSLVFVGRDEVKVYKKPIVALMSTGNELIDIQHPPPPPANTSGEGEWGGVYDTNRPSLQAALESMGYEVVDLGIVVDDVESHKKAIAKGLAEADVILTTGGTSMGPTDLLKPVVEREFGGSIHFGRVKVKPGKPTTFATIPLATSSNPEEMTVVEKPIFALPGNPASALVCFYIFVVPALRALGGWPVDRCHLARVGVQIQDPMPLDPRPEFHRVTIKAGIQGLKAFSTGGQRSSKMSSLSGANGLVALPAVEKEGGGKKRLEKGEWAEAVVIGEIQMY